MSEPPAVSLHPQVPTSSIVEATAEFPVVVEATADEVSLREQSAMADPHSARSPMSPDDHVSDKHTGLPMEQHTTGGTAP